MKRCTLFAFFTPLPFLVAFASITPAQPQTPIQSATVTGSSADAAAIVAKAQQSMGSSPSKPIPLSATGQVLVTATQETSPISIDVISPAVYRVQIGSGTTAYIWTANNGSVSTRTNGVVHQLRFHTAFYQRCELIPLQGVLEDTTQAFPPQVVPNSATANAVLQFQYQLPDPDGNGLIVTKQAEIDARSFLPVRVREIQMNEGNPAVNSQIEYVFSDYRRTGILVLPYHIEVYVNGLQTQSIGIDQFVVNAPLDLSQFSTAAN